MKGLHNEYVHPLMLTNFYSLEATDLSWRAELLPTTKVSIVCDLYEGEVVTYQRRRIHSVHSVGTHSCIPEERDKRGHLGSGTGQSKGYIQ